MDLDLAQVRAFVAAAEELHFGRAAARLAISQQGLSKRISRLETGLGARLFTRDARAVELTEAGRRFLAPARQALAGADRAVEAVKDPGRPVRMDVWGHLYAPMRSVGEVIAASPEVATEIGHTRDLDAATTSLLRGEIDAAFGRLPDPGPGNGEISLSTEPPRTSPVINRLASRLARLEPVDALLNAEHPLADRTVLRPADLRQSILWSPADLGRLDFLRQFADHFGIQAQASAANLGLDHLIAGIRADSQRFSLLPAELPLPPAAGVCSVPLTEPTALYAWSLIWRSDDQHPHLGALLQRFAEIGQQRRWLEYDPARDWLPAPAG
ncbi:MAG TPA: LysR family transcriptional regulator [Streptosporangiaceae bacterium]|nr:LysR family transcriptional regulator [Streptosporangiaceae bacterium]